MSEEHANALIALSRKLRSVAPKDLPIVDRCVLLAVAGRADADWIAFPPVEWAAREAGTTPNTARRALDRLVAAGWLAVVEQATARTSTRYRIQPDPVPPAGVTERYPRGVTAAPQGCRSATPARGDGAAPQGSRTSTPGVTEQHPRGDGAAPADHRKITSRSQKDPIRPAQARAGFQQSLLPDLLPSTTSTPIPATEPSKAPKKPPKDPAKPRAADLYATAYVAGHEDAGYPMTALSASERKLLGPIALAHARYRDRTPITGDALVSWIRRRARDFRRAIPDAAHHRGQHTPYGFRIWLDGGHDGAPAPLAPGQVEPPEWRPPPFVLPPMTPEERAKVDAIADEIRARHGYPVAKRAANE